MPMRAPNLLLSAALVVPTLFAASSARAQDPASNGACPPGSWFCDSNAAAPPAGQGGNLEPLPPPAPAAKPPPVVVVQQPPPPAVIVVAPREVPPPYEYKPAPSYPRPKEWGLQLRFNAALLGKGRDDDAHMGGLGLGVRYKPTTQVAVQGDVDFFGGRDYNGYRRSETAFSLNLYYFPAKTAKTQVYFLGGLGWSVARAVDDLAGYDRANYRYGYFGFQTGIGIEFRLSRAFALNTDLRGFLRTRVDKNKDSEPEFFDPQTGRTSNTSGGAMFTAGMTFYF